MNTAIEVNNYEYCWPQGMPPRIAVDSQWYAAYTCSRHEKSVASQLTEKHIDCFLPLYQSVHHWKDRYKEVELPLFPGYVFVRINLKDRMRVLQSSGVVRFVSFNGMPAPLDEIEIETLRGSLSNGLHVEPHPYLALGRRVRVIRGALAGIEGIVQRRKDKFRIVISVDLIKRSLAAEVNAADLEWLPRPRSQ